MSDDIGDRTPLIGDSGTQAGFAARLQRVVNYVGGQSNLSVLSGVPQPTISRILNGADPSRKTTVAIASATDFSLDWLLRGLGEERPSRRLLAHVASSPEREYAEATWSAMKFWYAERVTRRSTDWERGFLTCMSIFEMHAPVRLDLGGVYNLKLKELGEPVPQDEVINSLEETARRARPRDDPASSRSGS